MAFFLMPPARSEVEAAKAKLQTKRKRGEAVLGSDMDEATQQANKEILSQEQPAKSAFQLAEDEQKKRPKFRGK